MRVGDRLCGLINGNSLGKEEKHRLCGLINGNSLGKEEKHMIAVHDYRKPLVGHHSPIVHKERKKKKPSHLV